MSDDYSHCASVYVGNWPAPTLSRRDWFAGMAMQGIVLAAAENAPTLTVEQIGEVCKNMADALIAVLDSGRILDKKGVSGLATVYPDKEK